MLRSTLLAANPHAFTGRAEGDQRESSASLGLALGAPGPVCTVHQVHGSRVVSADSAESVRGEAADALVSTRPGLLIAVRVADCVPVLLAGPGVVAAIHAGWRGTAADVVRCGVEAAVAASGCSVESLRAAVGPSIRGCCYEVGDEVIEGVAAVAPGRSWLAGRHVDLAEANRAILAALGVPVEVLGGCTRCGGGWYSHRRGDVERQLGVIGVPVRHGEGP